jgi:cell division protein FtsL
MSAWSDMRKEIVLSVVMVFSAASLVYKWLSLNERVDFVVVFLAALLVASLALLLISVELRMQSMTEEFQNVRRTIAISSDELEDRIYRTIRPEIRELGERIDSLQRKLFR